MTYRGDGCVTPAASLLAFSVFRQRDENQLQAQLAICKDEARLRERAKHGAAQLRELFAADPVTRLTAFPRLRAGVGDP